MTEEGTGGRTLQPLASSRPVTRERLVPTNNPAEGGERGGEEYAEEVFDRRHGSADVNAVDNSDTSVLVWAERNGDAKIIKLLESAGARRRYYGLPPR